MRGALSLFLLCIALSQALVYETSFTVVPTTGYFSPIYKADAPAVFNIKFGGLSGPTFSASLCDERLVYDSTTTCTTYQVVVGTYSNEIIVFPNPVILTVIQSDIVQITLGQTYTSLNDTSYEFSSNVPYIYSLSTPSSFFFFDNSVGFSDRINVAANVTLTTRGSVHPLYATTYPQTYSVLVNGFIFGSSFMYKGETYYASASVCSSQDAVVLVDQSQSTNLNLVPARSCNSFTFGNGAFNLTAISTETLATLNASTSGNYIAICQTYGDSSDNYALVKLVNTGVTSTGGFINGNTIQTQPGSFDAVFNCGNDSSINLSIQVNGPYEPISINAGTEQTNLPTGFYQINVPTGIISDPFSGNLPNQLGVQTTCSMETSFDYFGSINYGIFDLCYTVTDDSTFDIPPQYSAFVIQPPQGYCIRSDGIPSNSSSSVYLYSNTSMTSFYEDENTTLYTVTCSDDILYVQLGDPSPMTINFTLVPISGQGVYGQTYDVDGLLILQYPPLTASAGMFSVNITGSTSSLISVANPRILAKRAVYDSYMPASNSLQTNTSPLSQFIVLVRGQGQMTTELGTSDGLNVGYDTEYNLYPSTSSTSSTEPSSSTSSISSEESTSAEEFSTESPSTSTVGSTDSTISVQSTSTSSTLSTSSSSFLFPTAVLSSSSSSSTSSVVSSSENEQHGTNSSSADATTTTSASVSFTDTSVIPTINISSDSFMVKASVLSAVFMVLFCLC
ncbi:hypothetical protein PROFUN_05670 [Planoprotostelium fungivorum]|uniref:Uncharacterized protein n=1 Tax=Planoprotostelium fungivorum TaxID=1890364 RepID=A0A2P6MUH6_9EUKA|nr:hypothetical protein PROFUN_05670 [Planoprotostelium fungivorum]